MTQTDRQTDRQTHIICTYIHPLIKLIDRHPHTHCGTHKHTHTHRQTYTHTQTNIHTHTQTDKHTQCDTLTNRHTQTYMYLHGIRIESILDITFPDHSEMSDGLDGHTPQHVVLCIGERLGGSDHNRFPRMDTKRIHVLHVAYLRQGMYVYCLVCVCTCVSRSQV